jgi:hypothetical protein
LWTIKRLSKQEIRFRLAQRYFWEIDRACGCTKTQSKQKKKINRCWFLIRRAWGPWMSTKKATPGKKKKFLIGFS